MISGGAPERLDRINSMPKLVVSRTMRALEWKNSTVIGASSGLIEDVRRLKNADGNELLIFGSTALIAALMPHDLIDEYRLLVYPVVLGAGQRLFLDGTKSRLKLKGSTTYGDDVLLLTYEPAR